MKYCRFVDKQNHGLMDSKTFVKLCRECSVVDYKKCHLVDVDLTFIKVKKIGERRIDYATYLKALERLSRKRFPDASCTQAAFKELEELLAQHCQPITEEMILEVSRRFE